MEGVVLVEMCSGALHYTKSFSTAFDERHPKTDRLNLAALIFALQNFAGTSKFLLLNGDMSVLIDILMYGSVDSSIRPPGGDEELDIVVESQSSASTGMGIVMFATPQERMVLAATPSNQLLVVRSYEISHFCLWGTFESKLDAHSMLPGALYDARVRRD
ncbi:hypothetical protein BBJ28_00016323 [Nothophytophthora sp. Chile5]|nr:hypothetical protein BBJ28_00016323 [Nothophytophthora sp. Chile5]